jgi:YVTN family beta-propeller protein
LVLLAVVCVALLAGCNDTLRQFIVPLPKPGGDQQASGNAVVLSTNPVGNGSTMHIDVSGDTIAGVVTAGVNPVFLGKGGSNAFVINGDGTVTTYLALAPLAATVHTATASAGTSGTVAGGTSSSGNFFTTNSGSNDSSVISSAVSAITQVVPVGARPVAIAGNLANSKMYVVNNGDNTVTVVSTTDNTVVKTIPLPAHSNPIWGVMAQNGVQVFIVNQGDGTVDGSVSVIDTTLDIVFTTIDLNLGTSASPNFAFYDPNRERLYVSNTGVNMVSVIKADGINLGVTPQILPTLLANVPVSGTPVSVAALNDGTKVYAALGNCPAGTNHTNLLANLASCNGNLVSVIDAAGLRESGTIAVGSGAVSVDVSGDASRAYAVAAHAGTVADIRAATNNVILSFPAPQQNLSCASPAVCPANATQTPFMVRTFP